MKPHKTMFLTGLGFKVPGLEFDVWGGVWGDTDDRRENSSFA